MFHQFSDGELLLRNFYFGCSCFSEDQQSTQFRWKHAGDRDSQYSYEPGFCCLEGQALRFVARATRGFRCCMQNYVSQTPRCAAIEPWWHLPSLGTFVLNSKVPQMHQGASAHRMTSAFQDHFVHKEEQEALGKGLEGRIMKCGCRRWGRAIHV